MIHTENPNLIEDVLRPPIVYFAGKITFGGGYRGILLKSNRVMSNGYKEYSLEKGSLIYGGPFAITNNHCSFHKPASHGWGPSYSGPGYFIDENGEQTVDDPVPQKQIVDRCLKQIQSADYIHAYIDILDCYGTLSELGYASAHGKPIYLTFAEHLNPIFQKPPKKPWERERDELWFIKNLPNVKYWCYGGPTTIHLDLFTPLSSLFPPALFDPTC